MLSAIIGVLLLQGTAPNEPTCVGALAAAGDVHARALHRADMFVLRLRSHAFEQMQTWAMRE